MPRATAAAPEALLLFAVIFGPLAFGAVESWSRPILEIDLLLMAFFCARRGGGKLSSPVHRTLLPAVLALIAIGVLQLLHPRPLALPASLLPFTVDPAATLRALVLWSSYAALLWAAPQVLSSSRARARFAWTLFGVGAFIALVGILQLGQGNTAYYGLRLVRRGDPFGPYVNRDHAASFLVMSAFVGGGLFLSRWRELRGRETVGQKSDLVAAQALMFFFLALVLAGVLMAKSRGAFNSFFLSLWAVSLLSTRFIQSRATRLSVRAVLGVLVPGYALFLALHPVYIGYVLSTPDVSTAYRLSMYRGGVNLVKDFPLWGTGLSSVQSAFPAYQEKMVVGLVDHVHSDWLELPMQLGLTGALILAAGFISFFARILRSWLRDPSLSSRLLTAGALCAVFAFLVHQSVDFSFQIPANVAIFLLILAYLNAHLYFDRTQSLWDAPRHGA